MKESLVRLCDAFIAHRDAVRAAFRWDNSMLYPVAASIFCEQGIGVADGESERLRDCRALLKEETGALHGFRGYAMTVTCAILAADGDPARRLSRSLALYGAFRAHFTSSQYLPVAAVMLSGILPEGSYAALAERTREIYDRMRKEHPLLTSSEDAVFAAMLALSDERNDDVILETERCYRILKGEFFSSNAVQSLSHVLALQKGRAEEKCERVLSFYRDLREYGRKYGTGYELATLGVLALLPGDPAEIREDLLDVETHLRGETGYGFFGASTAQRLMHAAMLVSIDRRGETDLGAAAAAQGAIASVIASVAAQQAALMAVIATSSSSGS